MANRSWVVAAGAAMAVLAVVAVGVAMSAGGREGAAVPAPDATVLPPAASPAEPSGVAPRDQAPISPDRPLTLTISSYQRLSPHRLQIRYATGVPECYGRLDRAVVQESAHRVAITLLLRPATAPASRPCPEIALIKDTVVHLTSPLGDRVVVDGATRRAVPRGHETP